MDPVNCYGCIHQKTPAEWGKCIKAYPGDTSCNGKKFKLRKDFIEWANKNQARWEARHAKNKCPYCEGKFKCAMCDGDGTKKMTGKS